ncbi:hypothetical protein GCM10020000_05850 [Streptomyces olivoverticillatus]
MTTTVHHHYWQGTFIDDEEAGRRLADLPATVEETLAEPLDTETVLAACERLAAALLDGDHPTRARLAGHLPEGEDTTVLTELAAFLGRAELTRKLRRELGGTAPSG